MVIIKELLQKILTRNTKPPPIPSPGNLNRKWRNYARKFNVLINENSTTDQHQSPRFVSPLFKQCSPLVANKIITTAPQTCKHQLKIGANAVN